MDENNESIFFLGCLLKESILVNFLLYLHLGFLENLFQHIHCYPVNYGIYVFIFFKDLSVFYFFVKIFFYYYVIIACSEVICRKISVSCCCVGGGEVLFLRFFFFVIDKYNETKNIKTIKI